MNKIILILSDGLRYDTAVEGMGYLGHLVETKQTSLYKVMGELPSMSRPMYETIHTGLPSSEHGVVSNSVVRLSTKPNIFQLATGAGRITAAAAYSWFSELYNRAPYNPVDDKEVDDEALAIQHGRFYTRDEYPDAELFITAAMLVRRFSPDYLLIHPMGMDYHGEIYGPDSSQYRNQAIRQDAILAPFIEVWKERGYTILVTSDHGINKDKAHGGTTPEVREVPLFLIQPNGEGRGDTKETVSQLQIAPTICKMLDIPIAETMKHPPISTRRVDLEKTPPRVAIFDLDYTLLEGDCEALWSQFLLQKGLVGTEFVARIDDFYHDYERGQLNFTKYEEFLLYPLTIHPLEKLYQLRGEYLERIRMFIRPMMLDRLNWHRALGHTLILVTASNSFLAEPIAALLHFPNLICTQVKRDVNSFTNQIEEIPAFRSGKVQLLDNWLAGQGLTLEGSWGYSDSHNDLPLLNRVEFPVAVIPDHLLRIYAQEHGWKIITGS